MGLLWTTEGTRRVLNTLNTAFDGPNKGLDFIRSAASPGSRLRKKIAKRDWKPGRLARMLKLVPVDQGNSAGPPKPSESKHKARWRYFLKNVLGPSAAFAPIRNALADAILNEDANGTPLKILRVSFDHVELASPANPNVVIFDAPQPGVPGWSVRHITLFTVPVPEVIVEPQPDPVDSDEPDPIDNPPWDEKP
jgi:hypothetical protein